MAVVIGVRITEGELGALVKTVMIRACGARVARFDSCKPSKESPVKSPDFLIKPTVDN